MSVKRWTAYIEDDDGNDFHVAHEADSNGRWVTYDDHAAEVKRLEARVRELTSEKDTIVSNAVGILTGGCLEHDEAVKAMTFDAFRKAVTGYTCPLCAKARVRELTEQLTQSEQENVEWAHRAPRVLNRAERAEACVRELEAALRVVLDDPARHRLGDDTYRTVWRALAAVDAEGKQA